MRRITVVVCLALSASALAAEIVVHVRFVPEEFLVQGTMTVRWPESPEVAWFALLPNLGRDPNPHLSPYVQDQTYVWGFDPSWTRVEAVLWEGPGGESPVPYQLLPAPPTLQTYSLEDVLLKVSLPRGEGRLRIDFRTRFPEMWIGEQGRLGDVYTWRFGWHPIPISPVEDGNWPLALQAHDYQVALALPPGWEAYLPGNARQAIENGKTVWSTSFAQPVRSVSLMFAPVGRFRRTELVFPQVKVEAVALPGHEDKVRALATYVPEILGYYAERYGPWGYDRVLLVEHPNEVGVAMAADGVVYIPRWYFDRVDLSVEGMLRRYGLYILAHELAHLYWGIGIGVDFDAENWLSEGMSQYLALRWFEDAFGATGGNVFQFDREGLGEEAAEFMFGFINLREHLTELPYLLNAFDRFDEAVVKPLREVKYGQVQADRLYNKGYLVLRSMAGLVGEDVFDRVLSQANAQGRGRLFRVADLQALLEEESGEDWSGFFSQWVLGEAWADYVVLGVTRTRSGSEEVTTVHLARRGTGWMPVTVRVFGPEGASAETRWDAREPRGRLEFRTSFPVSRVGVDPDHKALDTDRLNNWWPRKFVFSMGKREVPLDAYLLRTDVEGQGFTVSYLDRFGLAVYPNAPYGAGWVRLDRDWTLTGEFALVKPEDGSNSQPTLLGIASLSRRLWRTPPTGLPWVYWEPAGTLTVTVARLPEWTLGLQYGWESVIRRVQAGSLSLLTLPGQGWRWEVGHNELLSLGPHTYLMLTLSAGLASPTLPSRFLFQLGELWIKDEDRPGPGDRKFFGRLGLWLPPLRPNYALLGAAIVTEIRPYAYGAAGQLRSAASGLASELYAEVGGALVLRVEALGGLMSVNVVVGLIWPVAPLREIVFFVGVQ